MDTFQEKLQSFRCNNRPSKGASERVGKEKGKKGEKKRKKKDEAFGRSRGDRSEKVCGNVSHGGCFRQYKRQKVCVVFGAEPRHVVDTYRNRCTNLPSFLPQDWSAFPPIRLSFLLFFAPIFLLLPTFFPLDLKNSGPCSVNGQALKNYS